MGEVISVDQHSKIHQWVETTGLELFHGAAFSVLLGKQGQVYSSTTRPWFIESPAFIRRLGTPRRKLNLTGVSSDKDCRSQATHVGSCCGVTPEIHRCIFTLCDYPSPWKHTRQLLWYLSLAARQQSHQALISSTCAIRAFSCRKAFNRFCNQTRSERTPVECLSRLIKQSPW